MSANSIFNHVYKFIILVSVVTIADNPASVGYWEAQRDISYDLIWSEYLMDHTCTSGED